MCKNRNNKQNKVKKSKYNGKNTFRRISNTAYLCPDVKIQNRNYKTKHKDRKK